MKVLGCKVGHVKTKEMTLVLRKNYMSYRSAVAWQHVQHLHIIQEYRLSFLAHLKSGLGTPGHGLLGRLSLSAT